MDLLKIVLLMAFVALSQCTTKPKEVEYVGIDEDLDSTTEVVNNKPVASNRRFLFQNILNNPQCMCLPNVPHAKKISEQLNPNPGTDYERLVVYLFRNPITQEIKMYIPNSAKQQVFPDINFEIGEILTPLAPNATNVIFENIETDVHYWVKIINRHIIDIDIMKTFSQDKVNSILNYLIRFKDTKNLIGTLSGLTLHDKLMQLKRLHPDIYMEFMTKLTKFFPTWLNKGNILRFKPNELHNFPYDIKLIPYLFDKKIIINGQLQPNIHVEEITVYTPEYSFIRELFPYINSETELTFDTWLKIMLNIINNQLNLSSNIIDVASFKAFILDVVNKQGYSLVERGIIDSNRNFIQFSNIIVRPILIGESTLINRVINNGLFRIPTSVVFIESLIITGSENSLGIIPISHLFVGFHEEKITTTIQVIETITSCERGHCITKKICKNIKGHEEPCADFSGLKTGERTTQTIEKFRRNGEFEKLESPNCYPYCKTNPKCNHKLCASTISSDHIVLDRNSKSSLYPDSYPYIILDRSGNLVSPTFKTTGASNGIHKPQVLQHTVFPLLRTLNHSIGGGISKDVAYMYTNGNDKVEQNGEADQPTSDDEVPGIRIIGGKPATGSGTPVSTKG